jgi:hypothetical protein
MLGVKQESMPGTYFLCALGKKMIWWSKSWTPEFFSSSFGSLKERMDLWLGVFSLSCS